ASSLLDAGLPAYLVAAGGKNTVRSLQHPADLFEVLASRTREPVEAARTLALSRSLREVLAAGSELEPIILLLSQPWLGAEEDDLPRPAHLRGLFVPYPGHPAAPALGPLCERSAVLPASEGERLGEVLSGLVG